MSGENTTLSASNSDNDILSAPDAGTRNALVSKINNAASGSTIALENDYLFTTGSTSSQINIYNDITIDGQGYTIDANGLGRIFNIGQGYSVTLKNITFKNANYVTTTANDGGGAIHSKAINLTIMDCVFDSNKITHVNKGGGAIYTAFVEDASINIINSNFTKNTAPNGGAVQFDNPSNLQHGYSAYVEGCNFDENSVMVASSSLGGGAMLIYRSVDVTIKSSKFTNNKAPNKDGGAIRYSGPTTVIDCEFYSNTANHGAALCFGQAVDLNVYNSVFANNTAVEQGGAIKARYFTIDNATFTNNTATLGGAVFSRSGSADLLNSVFNNNSAVSGGALYVHEEVQTLVVSGNEFSDNNATSGGAVYSNAKGNVNIVESSFTSNEAVSGGAVLIYQGKASISASEFDDNSANVGGAVFVRANNTDVKGSRFENNGAPIGGAVYWHDIALNGKVSESDFISNDGVNGSSIYWGGNSGTVEKSTFNDDNLTTGSVYWHGNDGKISGSTFLNDKGMYLCAHSNVTLQGNKELSPEGGDYSVYIGNYATLIDNDFNNLIHNHGKILSPVYIKSLNNDTVMSNSNIVTVYTAVTDDNDNYILITENIINVFDSQNLPTTFNGTHFVSTVSNIKIGEYVVSSTGYDTSKYANLTVQSGMVIYLILNLTVNQTNYGEKVVITLDVVNTTYNGTVDIALNDIHYNVTLTNGTAVLTLYNLAPNTYDIVGTFKEYNQTLSADVTIDVLLRNSTINVTANDIYYGNVTTININTTNGTTGNVYVFINNRMYIVKLINSTGQLNVTGLSGGNYTVHALYTGDALFDSSYNDTNFTVYKFKPQIDITVNDIYVGQIATIKVDLPADATGKVHIDIGDKEYVYVNKTTITIYESNLTAGNISVRVNYLGDDKYYAGNKTVYFNVNKKNMTIRIDAADIPAGENATISVIIPRDAKGIVLLTVNGTHYFEYANGTVAKFSISDLTPGVYNVTAVYAEGPVYNEANASSSFRVNQVKAFDFNVTATSDADLNVYVDISLPSDIDGDVYVEINGTNYTAHMSKGKDIVIISGLTGGEYNGTVYLVNDTKYQNANRTFTIDLMKITPNIRVDYNHTIYVDDDAIIKVKINDDATGNITIRINNTDYISKIENGEALFNITGLAWNTYQFNVTYDGDRKYLQEQKEHTLEVSRIHNYYSYLETHDIFVGENATIKVTFEDDTTGNVTLIINGSTYTITLKNGTGSINITGLPVGKHIINATYNGDRKYEPCNRIFEDFHVNKIIDYPFTPSGTTNDTHANITVTLPADADGYVNITINNVLYPNVEVKDGKANLTVAGLESGKTYPTKIDYSGNAKYEPSSRNITLNSQKTLDYQFIVQGDSIPVGETAHIIVIIPEANDGDHIVIRVENRTAPYNMFVQNHTVNCSVIDLKAGEYSVMVEYEGNDQLEASTKLTHIYVSKISSFKFDIETNEPQVGENLTVAIQLPSDSTGNVTVTVSINNTNYTANVTNGTARVTIPNLPAGVYNATVYYSGDDKYHDEYKAVEVVVEKIDDYDFTVTPVDIKVGQEEKIKIELPKDITGTVTIRIFNTTYVERIVDVVNGTGWFNVTDLPRGDYIAYASLKNDAKYEDDMVYANFKVSEIDDYLFEVDVTDPNYVRDNITFTVHLPTDASGNVTVTIFAKDYHAAVKDGVAIINITAKEHGTFPYRVSFQEEGKYALKSQTGHLVISKLDVDLIPEYKSPVKVGENITFKVQLPKDATGTITFITRTVTYTATLINGSANFTLPGYPLAQNYSPSVSYSGDDRYNANSTVASVIVEKVSDYNLTVNVTDIFVGQTEIVNITLPDDATDDVLIYGNFSDKTFSQEIHNGKVSFNIADLPVGTYNITVLYQGYDKYVSKNVTKTFTVKKVNSTIAIELVNRNIVVTVPDKATGTVRITIDTIDEDVAIVNGKAILDISNVLPGEYLVTADYGGDENYFGNDTSKTIFIPKFHDYLINVTVEDIIVGETAIIIVNLPRDANGFANITVNKTEYLNVEVKNGVAKLNVTKLAVGNYDVSVNYADVKYAFNTNSTTFNVNKIKTVLRPTVTVDERNATVVVTINENATGNIIIYVDNVPYSRPIKDSKANVTITNLLPGEHIVRAHYDGNDNFTSADSIYLMFKIYPITDYDLLIDLTKVITVVQNNIITVTFPEYAQGRVTIYVNDDFYNTEIDPVTHNATVVLPWLSEGNYDVYVSYMDQLYDYKENSSSFTVIKLNTTVDVEVKNITMDLVEIINITLNENATGDVLIDVNGTVYHETLKNGTASISLSNLDDGNYTVIVTYVGDDFYNINSTSVNFTVSKIPVDITVNASDIIVGYVLNIKFNMSREITDLVTVQVGQTNYTTFAYKGNGSLDVYNLPVGDYNITVYYAGDKVYLPASNRTNITVTGKKSSQMNVSVADITVGEDITVYINTTEPINGTVYVTIAGLAYISELVNGKTNFTVSNLTARDYTISAFFMGNDDYDLCNATSNFTVHKKNTDINLDVDNINIGQYEILNVTVNENATGYVLISIGTIQVYANITNGTASAVIRNLAIGKYNVTVTYMGDDNFNSNSTNASFTVTKLDTTITINGSDIYVGQSVTFNITTSANFTEVIIVNVANNDGFDKNYTTFVEEGKGSLTVYDLPAGDYVVTAYFLGNTQYGAVNNTTTIKVNTKKPSATTLNVTSIVVGDDTVIYVNVTDGATGTVTIVVAGDTYTKELNNSKVNFTFSDLIARHYHVTAYYNGDEYYLESNATAEFDVSKKNTNIDLDVDDINIGQYEIVNVTVNENATGYILISIGTIHVYANITNGTASAVIRNLAIGKYNVTVTYMGDDNFNGNFTKGSFTVSQLKTTIEINGSDIYVGQSVTFNITTSANFTEVIIVNVANNDGFDENYTTFVEEGKGSLTVYDLPAGDYVVTAYFLGNTQYGAVNNTTTIKVSAKKASQVTVKVNNITVGEDAVIYVNVTDGATGTVTIIVAGDYYTEELNNSKANFTISGLKARDYHVSAVYLGDDYYLISNSSAYFTVNKKTTSINVTAKDINVSEIETINVNLTEGATGVVLIDINGTRYYANITNSKVSVDISNLAVGKYNVTVTYLGDDNFLSNETKANFTVTKLNPEFSIALHKVLFAYGEDVIIYLTGPKDVTGVVTVTVGNALGNDTYTAYINNGTGNLTLKNLDVDIYNVSASYQENYKYLAKNTTKIAFEVYQNGANISVTTHNIDVGQNETIIVTFPEGKFEGNVTIYVDGVPYNATLVYNATTNITKATLTLPANFTAGTYDVEATYLFEKDGKTILYEGANEFTVSKIDSTITINPIADIKFGENTSAIMVLTPGDATGEIHVYADGVLHIVDAANPVLELNNLPRNYYYIQAFYMGDDKYNPSETEIEFNVTKANPDIKLIIPDNPSVFTDTLIKVTINDTATVYINLIINGQDHLLEIKDGQVNLTINNIPAGTYDVVAYYLGDNNYNNATVSGSFVVTNDGNFLVNSTGIWYETLAEAVAASNGTDVIIGKPGTYTGTGNVNVTISGKNLTVTGEDVIFDAQNANVNILTIAADANVALVGLTYKNVKSDNKGAIVNNGNLTVIACDFINNTAAQGGAIFSNQATSLLSVENCTFVNNSARGNSVLNGDGGAIYLTATGCLKNCTFELNQAFANGGAIYLNGNVTIEDCIFKDSINHYTGDSTSGGGAIYLNNGNLTVTDSYFINNSAPNGGAIRVTNKGDNVLTLINSIFINNTATVNFGGAIESQSFISISNCTFNGNKATNNVGGSTAGGAIRILANMIVVNSIFENNHADIGRSEGGAISSSVFDLTIKNSTFRNNSAAAGGAINMMMEDGILTVIDSKFINNTASKDGGAIYSYGIINIDGSTFENNSVTSNDGYGGAIKAITEVYDDLNPKDAYSNISNSLFINNKAPYAAAISWDLDGYEARVIVTILNSTFINNSATHNGGAIWAYEWATDDEFKIINSTFENNNAHGYGGAIYNAELQKFNIVNSTFNNNTAENGQAIANPADAVINIMGSDFTDNGGVTDYAIYNLGTLTLKGNEVSNIIYNGGLITSPVNSTVLANGTYDITSYTYNLNATLVDDNGNKIYDPNFRFTINGELIDIVPDYDGKIGLYNVTYTIASNGRIYVVNVTTTNEEDLTTKYGILRNITGTYTDLRNRIHDAVEAQFTHIDLPYDFAYVEAIDGEELIDGINITNFMDIGGKGHTISGSNVARVFNVANGAIFTIRDMIICNATADYGGAINVRDSSFGTQNVTFVNNTAAHDGGAIYADNSQITFFDSKFINNTAELHGGAINAEESNVIVRDSVFDGNDAVLGNAIYSNHISNIYRSLQIRYSNFTNNGDDIDYAIYNKGRLNLEGNNVSNIIYNGGNILSKVIATLNGNKTITDKKIGDSVVLNATLVDDMGNAIYDPIFRIAVDGVAIGDIAYNESARLYNVASYTINHAGETVVSTLYDATVLNGIYFIPKFNATVNVTVDDIYVGENATVKVNVTGEPGIKYNETIIVTINSTEYIVTLKNGFVSFNVTGLTPGQYSVLAILTENANYTRAYGNDIFTVKKHNVPISIDDIEIVYGENATVIVKGLENITGEVITINIAGKGSKTVVVNASGMANATFDGLNSGIYEVIASYAGNATYAANSTNATLTVIKANTTIDIIVVEPIAAGSDVVINVTVNENATGKVNIIVDGVDHLIDLNKGNASYTLTDVKPGEHTVVVQYLGDNNYNKNETELPTFTVDKYATKAVIDNINTDAANNVTAIRVNITDKDGNLVEVTGNVTITVEDETGVVKTVTENINGYSVTIDLDVLAPGKYNITAVYNGDKNYANSTNDTEEYEVPKVTNYVLPLTATNITYNASEVIVTVALPDGANKDQLTIEVAGITYTSADFTVDGDNVVTLRIGNIAAGDYTVTATYNKDDVFDTKSNSTKFTVAKANTAVNVEFDSPKFVGDNVTITVGLNKNVNGTVILTVGDDNYAVIIVNGKGNYTLKDLVYNNYAIKASFEGNVNFTANASDIKYLVVNKIPTDINVSVEKSPIVAGETAVIKVVMNPTINAIVIVKIKDKEYPVAIVNGIGSLNLSGLAADTYDVNVTFAGDNTYIASNNTTTFKVNKVGDYNIIVVAHNITYGENETIIVVLPGDINPDNIIIKVDNDEKTPVSVINGIATVIVPNLPYGTHIVNVTYKGDEKYTSKDNGTVFKVRSSSDYNIELSVINDTYSKDTTFVVTVPSDSTGLVKITIDQNEIHFVKPNDMGVATLTLNNLSAGIHVVVATNLGDENYEQKSNTTLFFIDKASSSITIGVKDVYEVDEDIVITVSTENSTGPVSVKINGKEYNVTDGKVSIPKGLANGTYIVEAVLAEDQNYSSSYDNATFKVNKLPSSISATNATINVGKDAVITVNGPKDRTGQIIVDVDGSKYIADMIGGVSEVIIKKLDAGEYPVEITYLENDKYLATNTNATITVKSKIDPSALMNVTVDIPENSTNGTITVELPENATGNVTVVIDGKEYTVTNVTNGTAVIIIDNIIPGNHTIEVIYSGDGNYTGATNVTDVTVDKLTNYGIKASSKDIVVGETEVIDIELDIDVDGVVVDIGGIKYYVELTDGKGSLDVKDLDAGTYTAVVTYLGDELYGTKSNSTRFTVKSKIDPSALMNVTVDIPENSTNGTITVELPENATGNVTVVIDGKEYTVTNVTNGTAVIPIDNLTPGNHTVEVIYSGDGNYTGAADVTDVTVDKLTNYGIEASSKDIVVGETEVIDIELDIDVDGVVLVSVGGKGYYVDVVGGKCSVEIDGLAPGDYTAVVTYPGDDIYGAKSNTTTFTVKSKEDSSMSIAVDEDNKTITVELPEDATGNVTVVIDGKEQEVPIKDGKAVIPIDDLAPGNHTVEVIYPGDDKYAPADKYENVSLPKVSDYDIIIDPEVKGDELIVNVELPEDATGVVLIDVDGVGYYANVTDGKASVNLGKLPAGDHDISVTYPGDDKYASRSNSTSVIIHNDVVINAPEVIKYYSGPERFNVYVFDIHGKPLAGESVSITVNGVTYTRATDKEGIASIAIKLNSGEYNVTVNYKGSDQFNPQTVYSHITVKPTIYGNDVTKVFRNGTQYYGLFLDGNGNPLVNTDVSFNINGVFYTRTTNATGWAKLNLNLEKGKYLLTAINPVTGEMMTNNVTIISKIIENNDVVKYYRNGTQFTARILLDDGSYAGAGEEVTFNIHGRLYTRYTDSNGYVKLNINLEPGDYVMTTYYKDCREGNTIKVLPVLSASDLNMKYRDGSKFVAHLLDGQGNPYPNQAVTFNINGVIYNRATDSNGDAKLNINLQRGEYIITSSFNGDSISNKITIS